MSIKSKAKPILKATTGYPKLGVTSSGVVVLFSAERTGTVVGHLPDSWASDASHRPDPVGYYSASWCPQGFTDYYGTIELGNNYD